MGAPEAGRLLATAVYRCSALGTDAAGVAGDGVTTRQARVGLPMGMAADVEEQPEGWWYSGQQSRKPKQEPETKFIRMNAVSLWKWSE